MANLMDPMSIKVNLKAVASTIKATDENAAQRLEDLSLAVGGGSNADVWAASNIYQVIDPDNIITRYKNHQMTDTIYSVLEWARNTLIFAPLVVTWFGVSQAVSHYNDHISQIPTDSSQPFLLLWQSGFKDLQGVATLPDILKLSSLALIDFALLMAVLILTVATYYISHSVKLKREQEAENLRSRLTHALSGAILHLQTRNWQQPTNLLTQFGQVTQQFDATVKELLNQMKALADRQRQEAQTFNNFKNSLTASMDTMSSSAKDMKNSTVTLQQGISNLLTPAQEVAAQQKQLMATVQTAVGLFRSQTELQNKTIEEQKKWGMELEKALGDVKLAVANIQQAMSQQKGLVTAIEEERKQLNAITYNVQMAMNSLQGFFKGIEHYSIELHTVNKNMNDIVRRIATGRPV